MRLHINLSQLNPVDSVISYFVKNHFNLNLTSTRECAHFQVNLSLLSSLLATVRIQLWRPLRVSHAHIPQPQGRTTGPAMPGALIRHWKNRKYGASKLTFPHAEEFLKKSSVIRARALEKFRQPCRRFKKFKEYRF